MQLGTNRAGELVVRLDVLKVVSMDGIWVAVMAARLVAELAVWLAEWRGNATVEL